MLNVIICEDSQAFKMRTYDLINQYLMNTNIEYKIKSYTSYTDKLKEFIKSPKDGYTIYILDIQLDNDDSGIDIANDIRRVDFDSVIILETGTDLISKAQQLRLDIFHYVHKHINYDEEILTDLEKCLLKFKLQGNIKFRIEKSDYTIKYSDVSIIQADSVERKCVITTDNNQYEIKKPLVYFEGQINSEFYKINRGCIININNVEKVDYNKNIIKFKNGKTLKGMISNSNMKGLKRYVGSNK